MAGNKNLKKKLEDIRKQKMVSQKIVKLSDFRKIKKQSQSKTVLVVDDDPIMRSALNRILDKKGYDVKLAADGFELSEQLEVGQVDLILLDVNLPWVDGYEICSVVKDNPLLSDIPIVFVSARSTDSDIKKGYDAGGTDYVAKPFDVDQMTELVSSILMKSA